MEWLVFNETTKSGVIHCTATLPAKLEVKKLPLDAAISTVESITKQYPAPYYVMCSGGVDSQAMLWAWLQSGVEFTPVSFLYTKRDSDDIWNWHDLRHIDSFGKTHGVKIEYRTHDVFDFLENDLLDYALRYKTTSPQITNIIKMIEGLEKGTAILSGNYLGPPTSPLPFDYTILALHRFALQTDKIKCIPFFFMHDQDLAYSFNYHMPVKSDQIRELKNQYMSKVKIYNMTGFPVIPQNDKQSGFEKIKDYYDSVPKLISTRERLMFANEPSKRAFDIKFRYSLKKFVAYDDVVTMIHT